MLAGATSALLDLPLIEELAEFLHGAGEEIICGTDKALCDTLERWCMVASRGASDPGAGGSGVGGGSGGGSGGSGGSGYALPPPTSGSMMSALGGDPVGYLNEWIGSHYSPAPSPPSGPPSSPPPSSGVSGPPSGPPPSSGDPECHCSTIPPTQGQQLQSWVENQGQSVDPDILSSLRLCAIGGISEVISEHARELLMQWLEGDCPFEDVVKHVVVGWLGVGSGTSAPVSGPGGSPEGSGGSGSSLPPVDGWSGASHGMAWGFGGGAGGWKH